MADELPNLRGLFTQRIALGFLVLLSLQLGWAGAVSDGKLYVPFCLATDNTMLRFKDGVTVTFTPEVNRILETAEYAFQANGYSCVCTSGTDGKHMAGSKHYEAKAVDLRSFHVSAEMLPKIVSELQERLGKDYDVVLEKDHLHVEHDAKDT